MSRLALIAAAALALPAASDDPLAGYAQAGPAVHCLSDNSLSPVALDNHTVGLRRSARRWWISRVECTGLEPLSTLIVERYGGPLCDTDRFRTRRFGDSIPSRYCRFGPFTPYDRVKKAR
jgi:hypothetical protein